MTVVKIDNDFSNKMFSKEVFLKRQYTDRGSVYLFGVINLRWSEFCTQNDYKTIELQKNFSQCITIISLDSNLKINFCHNF